MRSVRVASMLAVAAILILRGGDCVPLLFADDAAKECCTKGKCSRSQKPDPCCEKSSSDDVQQFQAKDRVSVPALAELDFAFAAVCLPDRAPALAVELVVAFAPAHAPPGPPGQTSLPLLI